MGHAYFDCNDTTLSFSLLDGNPTITLRRVYERGDSLQAAGIGSIFSKSRGESRTLLRLDRQIQPPGDGFGNPSRA